MSNIIRSTDNVTFASDRTAFEQHLKCALDGVKDKFGVMGGKHKQRCIRHMKALLPTSLQPIPYAAPAVAGLIDGVVLVHYSKATCNLERVLGNMRRAGLPSVEGAQLQIAEHLDGEDLTLQLIQRCVSCPQLLNISGRFAPIELTQASCTLNHIYAYHVAVRMQWSTTLILEDDADLPTQFLQQLTDAVRRMPTDWGIYNFGCGMMPMKGGSLACSRGYLLSRSGRDHFARHAGHVVGGADWMIWGLSARLERANRTLTWQGGIAVRELSVKGSQRLRRGTDRCDTIQHGNQTEYWTQTGPATGLLG